MQRRCISSLLSCGLNTRCAWSMVWLISGKKDFRWRPWSLLRLFVMLLVLNSDCSTLCLKNVPPLTCYNIDIHDLIMITFGGSVTEKVRNQTMLCFPTSPIQRISFTLRKRKPRRQCTGALCMQHSPTVAVLLTSFSWTMPPQQPRAECIDYKILGVIQQHEYESWVKKRLKKSSSWLNSGNVLIQHLSEKCNFRVSHFTT